jgi:hypothetical protein
LKEAELADVRQSERPEAVPTIKEVGEGRD